MDKKHSVFTYTLTQHVNNYVKLNDRIFSHNSIMYSIGTVKMDKVSTSILITQCSSLFISPVTFLRWALVLPIFLLILSI